MNMNENRVNVISPPERFFNMDTSYLLVNPSTEMMEQFQDLINELHDGDDVNVFIYDTTTTDIEWLLSTAYQANLIIIDIDNCSPDTKPFVSFLLTHPSAFYMTMDEVTPYHLISKNRILDLECIVAEDPDQLEDEDE